MYCYQVSVNTQSVDYYTDEYTYYPETVYQFSDASVWSARLRVMLFLIKLQRDTTIVYFHEISVQLSAPDKEELVFLGSWFLRDVSPRQTVSYWDWELEAAFFEKHNLYRAGDKDLLAIERAHYQATYTDEVVARNTALSKKLLLFEEEYTHSLNDYAPELGILYFFIENHAKAFQFLVIHPMLCLQNITYNIAFYLAYLAPNSDYEYMKKYDALYDKPPFLS